MYRLPLQELESDADVVTYIVDRNINYTNGVSADAGALALSRQHPQRAEFLRKVPISAGGAEV
jgi:hypothetical protein